jgi:16S rRNA (cytosine967-C5)-methyltransferase
VPPQDAGATAARRAAIHILEACSKGRVFEQALEESARKLEVRDRRLAHELAAGVLRRQSALDAMLAPLVTRDWSTVAEPLRAILRLGAYQLTSLDRVPPHAAVATSVSLARDVSGARAAGFVNAVLRRLASSRPDPIETPAPRKASALAERFSHPEWLVQRWLARYGYDDASALLAWNDTRPRLALQPARDDLENLAAEWRKQGFDPQAAPYDAGMFVGARRPDQLEGFRQGAFLIQDPAQALVTRFAALGGALVYDACAAPGGKALALARQGARVIAGDRSRIRVRRIRQNTLRAGSGREYLLVADALNPPVSQVDAVLLDAPCLGTGTFSRHPDARWRVTPHALEQLVEMQRALLDRLALLVRPGGMLVYATCSLEPEENECQVDGFLTSHPEFLRAPNPSFPEQLMSPKGDLTILPHRHQMDGAYAARLRRSQS